MFVVIKDGRRFLEAPDYNTACEEARKDALRYRLSMYTIWNKATIDKQVRSADERPLYRITEGVRYSIT